MTTVFAGTGLLPPVNLDCVDTTRNCKSAKICDCRSPVTSNCARNEARTSGLALGQGSQEVRVMKL